MCIRRWLQATENNPLLPKTAGNSGILAANKLVATVTAKKDRKRGQYHHYVGELRAKIAKYACENGNKSAVTKFSDALGYSLSEATVRKFKRTYLSKLKVTGDADAITSLPHATLGRPLLIGEFDDQVYEYVKHLRAAGGIVNCNVSVAAAKDFINLAC